MTAELSSSKTPTAAVAVKNGKVKFSMAALAVGGAVGAMFLMNEMPFVGFLFLGHTIIVLVIYWMLAAPRPLQPGEAKPVAEFPPGLFH